MRALYASGCGICIQNFRNAYHINEKKWGNEWRISKAPLPPGSSNDTLKNMYANNACFPFKIRECVETESRFSVYTVCIASMILHTATYLRIIYAEICVNVTAECLFLSTAGLIPHCVSWNRWFLHALLLSSIYRIGCPGINTVANTIEIATNIALATKTSYGGRKNMTILYSKVISGIQSSPYRKCGWILMLWQTHHSKLFTAVHLPFNVPCRKWICLCITENILRFSAKWIILYILTLSLFAGCAWIRHTALEV